MANNALETVLGAVVLCVAGGFLYYTTQAADLGGSKSGYQLSANFFKADGLTAGSDVRVSGVKVGTVREVNLNPQTFEAEVVMSMRGDVKLPSDSSAKVASEGLLGGSFLAIEPGGSEYTLEAGEDIEYTQGSVSFLDLISKAVSSAGG